ncbi:MAG: UDP-glucose--hexose-1-phosphate uridylyltransferase [Saprospiraceae bacterium]|nr:UDP-glucose--hexose-1-phosphate uridylyltransferase [Saprospiraceae bacterium]
MNLEYSPHRRFNPLTNEWVLVSPHRSKRPWQGKEEKVPVPATATYDSTCYLCPGNQRKNGAKNPDYKGTFVFENDFAALLPQAPSAVYQTDELFRVEMERGICRVVCFSPDHSLSIPLLSDKQMEAVVDTWKAQTQELSQLDFINYIQIFENKGELMGCSNPHPHGQIWASQSLPVEIEKEDQSQKEYYQKYQRTLLGDYLKQEQKKNQRIVIESEYFVALVPFWAIWPFETMIIAKRPIGSLLAMSLRESKDLAWIYQQLTIRYDNLFQCSFPYSAGIHQSPFNGNDQQHWHLHLHFYPPLLRSATVRKFMVGYEMLATPQRDITAEKSAKMLRELPNFHYLHNE